MTPLHKHTQKIQSICDAKKNLIDVVFIIILQQQQPNNNHIIIIFILRTAAADTQHNWEQ